MALQIGITFSIYGVVGVTERNFYHIVGMFDSVANPQKANKFAVVTASKFPLYEECDKLNANNPDSTFERYVVIQRIGNSYFHKNQKYKPADLHELFKQ